MSRPLDTAKVTRALLAAAPSKPRAWTAEEVAFLRKHYRGRGAKWCAAKLGRSTDATERAAYLRHITRCWSQQELVTLRAEWGEVSERSLRHKLPGRPWGGIVAKAAELGLSNPNQGKSSMAEAVRLSGLNRRRLRLIFAEYGVRLTYRIRTRAEGEGAYRGRHWVFDMDEAMEAVRAWLITKAARLNRTEAMARTGLSMHHTQRAVRMLAGTRPVEGFSVREWSLSPEDVDAAAAMYRTARGER